MSTGPAMTTRTKKVLRSLSAQELELWHVESKWGQRTEHRAKQSAGSKPRDLEAMACWEAGMGRKGEAQTSSHLPATYDTCDVHFLVESP